MDFKGIWVCKGQAPEIFLFVDGEQSRIAEKSCEIASAVKAIRIAKFDVVLIVADKKQKGGKIGVLLWDVGAGGGKSESAEASQVSRVKFSVPYKLP